MQQKFLLKRNSNWILTLTIGSLHAPTLEYVKIITNSYHKVQYLLFWPSID